MIWLKQLHAARKLFLILWDYSEDVCDLPLKKWQIADRMRSGRQPGVRENLNCSVCVIPVKAGMESFQTDVKSGSSPERRCPGLFTMPSNWS
jgi:hypothetical protein